MHGHSIFMQQSLAETFQLSRCKALIVFLLHILLINLKDIALKIILKYSFN